MENIKKGRTQCAGIVLTLYLIEIKINFKRFFTFLIEKSLILYFKSIYNSLEEKYQFCPKNDNNW